MPLNAPLFPQVCSLYRSVRALAAFGAYLGMSSVIFRMKSDFSAQPLQDSPHSSRIFFRSFTFSFFRSTVLKSTCLSAQSKTEMKIKTRFKQIYSSFLFDMSQTSRGIICLLTRANNKPASQHFIDACARLFRQRFYLISSFI